MTISSPETTTFANRPRVASARSRVRKRLRECIGCTIVFGRGSNLNDP